MSEEVTKYEFSVKNASNIRLFEPHSKTILTPKADTSFKLNSEQDFKIVARNLEQLAVLYKGVGFSFNREQVQKSSSSGCEQQKLMISVVEW